MFFGPACGQFNVPVIRRLMSLGVRTDEDNLPGWVAVKWLTSAVCQAFSRVAGSTDQPSSEETSRIDRLFSEFSELLGEFEVLLGKNWMRSCSERLARVMQAYPLRTVFLFERVSSRAAEILVDHGCIILDRFL